MLRGKSLLVVLLGASLLLTACGGNQTAVETKEAKPETQKEVVVEEPKVEEKEESSDVVTTITLDELNDLVDADVDESLANIKSEYDTLIAEVNSYDLYLENTDRVEAFYADTVNASKELCDRLRQYSIQYSEIILASEKSNSDKYDDLDDLYDTIYDDAGDDIYDAVYDGVLNDMYDMYYDGILDDAYDHVEYDEWADAKSDEYDFWSDAKSDAYDDWSDMKSDVYDLWLDMKSEVWDGDMERAYEKLNDFKEDLQ